MRSLYLVPIAGLLFLAACSDVKRPSDADFAKAINDYLTKHGAACTVIGRQFPIDVPRSEQGERHGIGPKLAALELAGLVHASDTTAAVHGVLDSLRGSSPPQPVKRYELTTYGKKYFQQIPRHARTNQWLLLRAERRRFHCQMDGAGDGRNILANRGHLHLQDCGLRTLGRTPGGATGVFGHPNDHQRSIENNRGRWLAVDQRGLGSSGAMTANPSQAGYHTNGIKRNLTFPRYSA